MTSPTVVRVVGSAAAEFSHVAFKVSVTTTGKTGPMAKNEAAPRINAILSCIQQHAESAKIETDRLKTSFAVDVNRRFFGGEHVMEGYKAVYSCSFFARNVAEATKVHDALTSIEGIESPTPVFHIAESREVHARAYLDGSNKARERFEDQCKANGLNPSDFRLDSWRVDEERPMGKGVSLFNSAEADAGIEVEPGRAVLDLFVTLTFVRKN